MDLPPPSTRPPTSGSSTAAGLMPQTGNVPIQVENLAAKKTLRRGLEARQVSTTVSFRLFTTAQL